VDDPTEHSSSAPHHPLALDHGVVHVWRVPLADPAAARALRPLLDDEERARADRFYREEHRVRFAVAHGWKRRILARYAGRPASSLRFVCGEHGKPSLAGDGAGDLHFNLSHSGDLALVAVARTPVGVDVERWDAEVEHLELAERFFSPSERGALRALAEDADAVVAGFFAAWSRKEAYLKATGHGISRGLHHFDVTLAPGVQARLLADRLDPAATARWVMHALDVAPGYSAALVAAAPVAHVRVLDPTT
jgi:4'-phosphopantetheinyl transferase